eukprot:Skav226394  [mRNA]  locus=scaffold1631:175516:176838:+ [translate_table: standard]
MGCCASRKVERATEPERPVAEAWQTQLTDGDPSTRLKVVLADAKHSVATLMAILVVVRSWCELCEDTSFVIEEEELDDGWAPHGESLRLFIPPKAWQELQTQSAVSEALATVRQALGWRHLSLSAAIGLVPQLCGSAAVGEEFSQCALQLSGVKKMVERCAPLCQLCIGDLSFTTMAWTIP